MGIGPTLISAAAFLLSAIAVVCSETDAIVLDTITLRSVDVTDKRYNGFVITRMDDVGNGVINAAKKTELVQVQALNANTSTNNPRQIFSSIVGLNVWESDALGLQLGIGGRGLSPDRSSNFTTRQNSYDIAADPLGYPESYYTPPMDFVDRIEVTRGGAALRYGTQFGGVVNFVMREPTSNSPLVAEAGIGAGSFGLAFGTARLEGGHSSLGYSGSYQFRRSDGWRPNSEAHQHTAYASLMGTLGSTVRVQADYTFMSYLAQQPGGLSDKMFADDPQQSVRARNWFTVTWNVASLRGNVILDSVTSIQTLFAGLASSRTALGNLDRITMVDRGGPRTMIDGSFLNLSNETTITRDVPMFGLTSSVAAGIRLFTGRTRQQQGDASDGAGPDFTFLHPDSLEGSDYTFPNSNVAGFAEAVIRLGGGLSIVPGMRVEHINTQADGWYRILVKDLAGNHVVDSVVYENNQRSRSIVLAGLGMSWHTPWNVEVYGNAVQNYRAITFTDLRVVNPNIVVNPDIQDERGYTLDLGMRAAFSDYIAFDVSLFYLRYNNKIGEIQRTDVPPLYLPYRYRTNVADAYTAGVEAVVDLDVTGTFLSADASAEAPSLHLLVNSSVMDGRYVNSSDPSVANKLVELVPPYIVRVGASIQWRDWSATLLQSWVGEQYSDATNAEFSASAVTGIIPAYAVMDLTVDYRNDWLHVRASANNLLNASYFTRRAVSYPGPGIIPAEPLTLVLNAGVNLPVIR